MAWQNETNIKGPSGAPGPAGPTDWNLLTNKPATFPPTVPIAWTDVSGKPATFPPTLPIAQSGITNLTTDLAGKVAKAGDTMTGDLTIGKAVPQIILNRSAVGQFANLLFQTTGLNRWIVRASATLEGGANAGNNFQIARADDAGAEIDNAFNINRSTGIVAMSLGATTLAPAAADSTTRIPTTAWVAGELATANALKVAKAGDTMTGNLSISPASGAATLSINATGGVNSALLQLRKGAGAFGTYITSYTGSALRWALWLGDSSSESGADAGSQFVLNAYDDAGAVTKNALRISRADGIVQTPIGLRAPEIRGTATGNTELVLGPLAAGNILFRPGGDGSVVGAASINSVGILTTANNIIAGSGNFIGTANAVVLGTNTGGTGQILYLRPVAYNSATGQTTINAAGDLTTSGALSVGTSGGAVAKAGSFQAGAFSATGATAGLTNDNGSNYTQRSSVTVTTLAPHFTFYNPNGAVGSINTTGSATTFVTSSDENLKNLTANYDPVEAIAIIRADPVLAFDWKTSGESAIGWFAQRSYAVDPNLAVPPSEPTEGQAKPAFGEEGYEPWGIDYGRRTPYLWAALTWALDQIDELKAKMAALEGTAA